MRNVGSVLGNRADDGMPGRPERRRSRPTRAGRGRARHATARVADAKLVEEGRREVALVARRERPRRRLLRAERARRHAAAVRQRGHRNEAFREPRQPPEDLVAAVERSMVDAER